VFIDNTKKKNNKPITPEPLYKNPFTDLERWFYNLPNMGMWPKCQCGSGKPEVYWMPEDGTACRECKSSFHIYIPSAVLWNIVDKFKLELSPADRIKLFQMVEDPENELQDY
jgi:hypothetical protein